MPEVIEPGCGRKPSGEVVDYRIRVPVRRRRPKRNRSSMVAFGFVPYEYNVGLMPRQRYAEVSCLAVVCHFSVRMKNRTFTPSAESEEGP